MEPGHKLTKTSYKQINSIKILAGHVIVNWDERIHEIVVDAAGNVVKEDKFLVNHPDKSDYPPHQDFLDAMKMLRKMVIDICGFKGEFANFQLYRVLGVNFSGMDNDETAKVSMVVSKLVERTGQAFTFNTPPTTLFNAEVYADAEKLDKACAVIRDEAFLYRDGKHADVPQLSLEFESGENMKMHVQEKESGEDEDLVDIKRNENGRFSENEE